MPSVPPGITIEHADGDDVDTLVEMWTALATDQHRHGSHLRARENRTPIRELMSRHAVTETALVARRDTEMVGFITFGIESGVYKQNVVRGIVHNIYVETLARGDGIGRALLDAAERRLDSMGADIVALQVMAENDSAREFYGRHGYTPHRIELEKPINNDPVTSNDG